MVRQLLFFSTNTEPDIVLIDLSQGLVLSLKEGEKMKLNCLVSLFTLLISFGHREEFSASFSFPYCHRWQPASRCIKEGMESIAVFIIDTIFNLNK